MVKNGRCSKNIMMIMMIILIILIILIGLYLFRSYFIRENLTEKIGVDSKNEHDDSATKRLKKTCSSLDTYTYGECTNSLDDINYNTIDLNPTKSLCKGSLFLPAIDMSGATIKRKNNSQKNCLSTNTPSCMWY